MFYYLFSFPVFNSAIFALDSASAILASASIFLASASNFLASVSDFFILYSLTTFAIPHVVTPNTPKPTRPNKTLSGLPLFYENTTITNIQTVTKPNANLF